MPCRPPLPTLPIASALAVMAVLMVSAVSARAADQPERVVTASDRSGLALTLYQDDSALVHDRRAVTLDKGPATLVWEDVAREARPATAILSGNNLKVRAQSFDSGGGGGERMLARAVGHDVTLVWRDGGTEEHARVLAAGNPPLFDIAGKVVAGQPQRIIYDDAPASLRAGPVFTAEIAATAAGRRDVELAYLTGGLGWQADYVAELLPGGDRILLSAWTTLSNSSGIDFPEARVTVVSGRPNRVFDPRRAMVTAAAPPEHEAIGPYQMYRLPEAVSLRDGESAQAVLLPPTPVKVERELVLEPMPPHAWRTRYGEPLRQNPIALLRLDNVRTAGLGQPLPAGTLHLYQRGRDGGLVFLGEDRLAATPEHASAAFAIGQALDVTARRTQTDFQHVSAEVSEAAYETDLTNAGDKPVTVTVRESFGADWLVLEESEPHHRDDAFSASWPVRVPAKGEAVLKYRVRVKG